MQTTEQPAGSDSDKDWVIVHHDQISDYSSEQMLPKSPKVIQRIRSWLQPTSYDLPSGEYRKHLASHMAGTGSWLTSHQSYKGWLEKPNQGLLWIQGCPGSGKSVMAAKLVHELANANPDCPVLFFFSRQIIDANHQPQALLRDWMDQVLRYSPPLQAKLETYVKSRRSIETMSMEDMWRDLRMAFASLPKRVFCVADALDEMDRGNDAFLTALGSLGKWRPDKVKVLMTSRIVPNLQVPLRGLPCIHMRLEELRVDADISTFVRQSLGASSIAWDDWGSIMDAVPGRANGIFLYAKLAMNAFLEPGAHVNTVLAQLPADLNVLYTKLLREHAARSGVSRDIQHLLLQSVTHASRPLRLLELAEMIKVHQPEDGTRGLKTTKSLIRIACGPLLEILPDETVSVIHHSFTEYLKGATRPDVDEIHYPVLEAGPTHARLATACVQYLLSGCLRSVKAENGDYADNVDYAEFWPRESLGPRRTQDEDEENRQKAKLTLKHPFAKYAIDNWHHHVRQSEAAGYDQQQVSVLVAKLLGDTPSRKLWLQLTWPGSQGQVTQLHIASQTGLLAYTRELLKTMQVDEIDAHGKTALWWAANEGHVDVVEALLAAGANPDKDESIYGLKPLHQAAEANNAAIVTLLLQAGVDALTPKTKGDPVGRCGDAHSKEGDSPLMYACHNGHMEAVSAFLPFLSKRSAVLALHWAAERAQGQVVARIIQQSDVDVNADVHLVTPLSLACSCGDVESVRALILAGADPNNRNVGSGSDKPDLPRRETCLHALAGLGHGVWRKYDPEEIREIFSLLVDNGVDIHLRDSSGKTALHGAASSPVLTRLLLNAGADANTRDREGCTPLHYATSIDVISILIEKGHADINLAQNDGETVLLRMLAQSDNDSVLAFLEYGPDCNLTNNAGDGALHILMKRLSLSFDVVNAMFKRNADPNLRNMQGLTPLLTLLQSHRSISDDVLGAFVEAGVDLNAANRQGQTWLFSKMKQSYGSKAEDVVKDVQSLIDWGASVTCRDNHGRTLLHEAMGAMVPGVLSSSGMLDAMVDLGMDLKAVDYSGNTLIHELALRNGNHCYHKGHEYVPVYDRLLELGLDLEQKNHKGQTVLHILCSARVDNNFHTRPLVKTRAIDYVLSKMENVDVIDNDGMTPLHVACTLGELYSKKLLDAGADATAQAYEGFTALHLAARCCLSNVVGMLLGHLKTISKQIAVDAKDADQGTTWLKQHVNATTTVPSHRGYTPLHFACQSGIPETVSLLLDSGADLEMPGLLQACDNFAKEDKHWKSHQTPYTLAVKMHDTCLWFPDLKYDGSLNLIPLSAEARIEEIVDMLFKGGLRPKMYHLWSDTSPWPWHNDYHEYTNTCIRRCVQKYGAEEEGKDNEASLPSFSQPMDKDMAETVDITIRGLAEDESPMFEKGGQNIDIFVTLLSERRYDSIPILQEIGTEFLYRSRRCARSNLALLVQHGFTSLVDRIGKVEAETRFASGEWRAHGDASRPGLWRVTPKEGKGQDGHQDKDLREDSVPLLLGAVQRVQPNLDVIKVLVEKLGVHLDQVTTVGIGGHAIDKKDTSALLYAVGGYSWWHAYKAVPYLIQAGADLEVTNHYGQTPLQVALRAGEVGGIFSKETCRALVHAGANVDAVDALGVTCLAHAGHDASLMHLLLDNGAHVSGKALLAAIDSGHVEAVQVLLSRGTDANMRPDKTKDEGKPKTMSNGMTTYCWREENAVEPGDLFALYRASYAYPKEAGREMTRLLLRHGADPMAKYLRRVSWGEEEEGDEDQDEDDKDILVPAPITPTIVVPNGYQEQTILHSLLFENKSVDEFLRLPRLDVNHRDASGQTVLLAACISSDGLDHPAPCSNINRNEVNNDVGSSDQVTILQRLIALGADIGVRDNGGRNALHALATRNYKRDKECTESLKYILHHAPGLIHQADIGGCTPLHLAILSSLDAGNTQLVRTLLDAGADASATTNRGDTVLHLFASGLRWKDIRLLFKLFVEDHGLDVNARNNRGETPVFGWCKIKEGATSNKPIYYYSVSEEEELESVTALLVELGVDFSVRDNRGRSLLHLSAGGTAKRFQCLMDLGLDATVEDETYQTAIDIAAAKGNKDVLRLFEKK